MLRTIMGILAGVACAMLLITLVELVGRPLHPVPAGVSLTDTAAVAAHLASAPTSLMGLVVVGWVLGAFGGALVAGLVARPRIRMASMVVGVVVVAAVIANAVMLPQPVWMTVLGVVLPLVAAYAASTLATRIAMPRLRG